MKRFAVSIMYTLIWIYSAYASKITPSMMIHSDYVEKQTAEKCGIKADEAAAEYFIKNTNKQINASNLTGEARQNAIIRNLCFSNVEKFIFVGTFCDCQNKYKDTDILMSGFTLKQIRNYGKINCFKDNISKVKKFVYTVDEYTYKLFMPDIDEINSQILSGQEIDISIDANPSLCWTTDKNGDNIWHAMIRARKDVSGIASLCSSSDITKVQDAFFTAAIYAINNNGESPVYEALRTNHNSLIHYLKMATNGNKATCKKLANEVYSQTENKLDFSLQDIEKMFGC